MADAGGGQRTFEFVVEGPPVPLRAAKKNARRYQKWVRTVRTAAELHWPPGVRPVDSREMVVQISNYHSLVPADIDNIIKPILDGMEGVVYGDDKQVYRVTSERIDLARAVIANPSPVLAGALGQFTEFVYVQIAWAED